MQMNNLNLHTTAAWRNLISRMLDKRNQMRTSTWYLITFLQSTKKGKTMYVVKIPDSDYLWGLAESRQQ